MSDFEKAYRCEEELMGMYTELLFRAETVSDCPDDVISVLMFLFGGQPRPHKTPEHEFFATARWMVIGRGLESMSSMVSLGDGTFMVYSISDLKNYDDEIDKFIDWVSPYVVPSTGECLGWTWYEQDDMPRLIAARRN